MDSVIWGVELPATHFAVADEVAAFTPIAGSAVPLTLNSRPRFSTVADADAVCAADVPSCGVTDVIALAVSAVTVCSGMASGVARLFSPTFASAHCSKSGLVELAVLGLPLATIGSTRLLPLTEAQTALERHVHTGEPVKAPAGAAHMSQAATDATHNGATRAAMTFFIY
ncbi:MAG TPA: hypothetical protein VHX88_01960 [Solirubrobacteraceae bacterium]|nr:hypothetical protein [Solirubrobacteraceae bacterium]